MFLGSLPTPALQMIGKIVQTWNVEDIYIGCSGNFTIERCLKNITNARLHSNDVTVYSCLLGRFFSGQKIDIKLKSNYNGPMNFVQKYFDGGVGSIAVMLILSDMTSFLKSKPNPYYKRMINAYITQFEKMFNETKEKLEKIEPFITSMYEGDVYEWIDTIPDDAGFICYPPPPSENYVKIFRAIDNILEWNPPIFEALNEEKINDMFSKLIKRNHFLFITNDLGNEYAPYLAGMCQISNRDNLLNIYANADKTLIVLPHQKTESPLIERLGEFEDIGNEIQLRILKIQEFQALRSQYMNIHINPAHPLLGVGVMVDNKLIGVYALKGQGSNVINMNKYIDAPNAYLLSDFPIAPVKYKRLAKLVLYSALSKESKDIIERIFNRRIYSLATTAFSKKPVSMKYRGLFHLLNKTQTNESEYKLNYGANLGEWTLAEGLKMWKDKYGNECVK